MNNNQLNQFQIFDDLNDDQINQFHSALKEVTIDKGEQFIKEGEQGDSIYLLLSGSVEINQALTLSMNKGESDNREKAILKLTSEMHPQFGEMSIFNEYLDRRSKNLYLFH